MHRVLNVSNVSMGATNLLRQAFALDRIRSMGATIFDEGYKYIKKDACLSHVSRM
ncbi:hypothetical protein C2845_PM04G08880 [Panicum miliaceum]|uniref:Uncharacterized protein n=1 Tax=Panicum miliaceum TaxID=4540 RepID=A0A3L6QLE4_PANMI|nr:hypothetical protein C2845_PM04G08880 [Panicum miliaceum]